GAAPVHGRCGVDPALNCCRIADKAAQIAPFVPPREHRMHDLNDLYYCAAVGEPAGLAAAARALRIPKSRLSRRISQLEAELGVRLLQRSTPRFAVTDVGQAVYRHAQTMLSEAQAAREVVDRLSAEPRGVVRVSVPVSMA